MKILSNFDSGNIQVITADDPQAIQLSIPADAHTDIAQWFHFRLESEPEIAHHFQIVGLAHSAYPEGWKDYDVVASYDRQEWFRIPSEFDGETLSFTAIPEYRSMYFAYFAPFSYERHQDLLHQAQLNHACRLETLGQTIDGNDISLLTIDSGSVTSSPKKNIWLIARQHPGETMAEWFIEGLLQRLLDDTDTVARALLDKAIFHIVPNMNPDGSIRGHLRHNALGVNLNREWATPSIDRSPEVHYVRERMLATGMDLMLDIHGDEAIPYNFVAGSEGIPSYNAAFAERENRFKQALLTISPEFQVAHGYPLDEPGQANLTVASNWCAEQFGCLTFTVEMPFKDHNEHPDDLYGWSPERSIAFGQDMLAAVRAVIDEL